MPVEKKKIQWGDESDEENEVQMESTGVKERVRVFENAKGQKVRTVTKVRVKEIRTKVPVRVYKRRNLPRFGEAKEGEENVTLKSNDFVGMDHPDDAQNEDADDPTLSSTLTNFIARQAESKLAREHDLDLGGDDFKRDLPLGSGGGSGEGKSDRYVAPGRGAGGAGFSMSGDFKERDNSENTLRVSNLTKAVTEDDLRDLFERFGRIHRVSLPKIEKPDGTKEPRGFAYIAFANHEDAEKAMERLQGYGYDHLIIKLEWAKPNKDAAGGADGGGSGGRHMSGYGQKLAQETTEKVYFASNLTGHR